MSYKKVYLKPGKEESLKRFHPWVFSGAIHRIEGEPEEGEVVNVYTSKNEFYMVMLTPINAQGESWATLNAFDLCLKKM